MFEFTVALKYLLPKRKALSTAIISLLSVCVISLAVWLVLVFLSVTTGIEKNWLKKLTSLNAPLRITPTDEYFASYYYQIDKLSSASNYSYKTIGEKIASDGLDPYIPDVDMELPLHLAPPAGTFHDPVKTAAALLDEVKKECPNLVYQDYEMSGSLMRLGLTRQQQDLPIFNERTSFLSQMSYLVSLAHKNPALPSLILAPKTKDLNNLLYQMGKASDEFQKDAPQLLVPVKDAAYKEHLQAFFSHLGLKKIQSPKHWLLPAALLPDGSYAAYAKKEGQTFKRICFSSAALEGFISGQLIKDEQGLHFQTKKDTITHLSPAIPIVLEDPLLWEAKLLPDSLKNAQILSDIRVHVAGVLQNHKIQGTIPFKNIQIAEALPQVAFTQKPTVTPLWSYFYQEGKNDLYCELPRMEEASGILLPKSYQDNGVLLGDKGYLSYLASTGLSTQEQRLPFYVAGFYDPGIMPVGNRCLLVSEEITRAINSASPAFSPDGTPTNGILVWAKDIKDAPIIKEKIAKKFHDAGISSFFRVATYKEYEFSKDLMQQFQSDRTLFTLIATIIIIVACCNIISLLVLLVNDKKKEIAILGAMGATKSSIALIFGACGVFMGFVSSIIGTFAAILTLKNLDSLVALLSSLQGHAAFQAAFFGDSLPNELSKEALLFVLIATPIISLLAGLVPAIKAAKLKASPILRAE